MQEDLGIDPKHKDCVSKEYCAKDELHVEAVAPSSVILGTELEASSNREWRVKLLKRHFSMFRLSIFESSVWRGSLSFAAAPFGPATSTTTLCECRLDDLALSVSNCHHKWNCRAGPLQDLPF